MYQEWLIYLNGKVTTVWTVAGIYTDENGDTYHFDNGFCFTSNCSGSSIEAIKSIRIIMR